MISESTRMAVMALVEVDGGVTEAEKCAIAEVLTGKSRISEAIVKFTDAAKRLGVTKMTVFAMVKRGQLKAVAGASRNIGVTEDSIQRLIKGVSNG